MSVRRRLLISGLVQGVGYRWSAHREASRLGLRGWVRNLVDRRVEALVEGDPDAVAAFEAWCRQGPPSAQVDDVLVQAEDDAWPELEGFEIRR